LVQDRFLCGGRQQAASGRNQAEQVGLCGRRGHSSSTPEALELCIAPAGALKWRPVVLTDLQRKGMCGKRSISAVLIFWLLFYQEKSNKPTRGD